MSLYQNFMLFQNTLKIFGTVVDITIQMHFNRFKRHFIDVV
jgi:hypothetical protein